MSKSNVAALLTPSAAVQAPQVQAPAQVDILAEIARLKAENEALKAKASGSSRKLTLKVTEKGGLSVYGMGRFPVTLYREQWEKLLGHAEDIKAFIKANEAALKTKA